MTTFVHCLDFRSPVLSRPPCPRDQGVSRAALGDLGRIILWGVWGGRGLAASLASSTLPCPPHCGSQILLQAHGGKITPVQNLCRGGSRYSDRWQSQL